MTDRPDFIEKPQELLIQPETHTPESKVFLFEYKPDKVNAAASEVTGESVLWCI